MKDLFKCRPHLTLNQGSKVKTHLLKRFVANDFQKCRAKNKHGIKAFFVFVACGQQATGCGV